MTPKKVLSTILVLVVAQVITIPSFAVNLEKNSHYVEFIETSSTMSECITIDDLISHSTILNETSNSMSGHYNGDQSVLSVKIGNIVAVPDFPWTHTVEFDWSARLNSEGDYVFDEITNANSSISPGTHLFYLNVESNETKDVYSFSRDRKSVTFSSSYELQWRFYNEPFTTTATAELTRIIEMQELI